ncbi:MAG: hypothetical protein WCH01_09675 [Methylococcaceae bacterium]
MLTGLTLSQDETHVQGTFSLWLPKKITEIGSYPRELADNRETSSLIKRALEAMQIMVSKSIKGLAIS